MYIKKKEKSGRSSRPELERVPVICHCHQMANPNPRQWDNAGSTCIIKCTNVETGERYGYDDLTRRSTCPACTCQCTAAFEVSILSFMILLLNYKTKHNNQQHISIEGICIP